MDLNKLSLEKRESILKYKKELNKIQANIKNLTEGDDLKRIKNLEIILDKDVFSKNSNKYNNITMIDFILNLLQKNSLEIQDPHVLILQSQIN